MHVLQTLRLVYARAGRTAEVTAMYQAAAAAEPADIGLQEGVFAAHVRWLINGCMPNFACLLLVCCPPLPVQGGICFGQHLTDKV